MAFEGGWRRLALHATVVGGLVVSGYILFVAAPTKGTLAADVVAYWGVDLAAPYAGTYGEQGFFPYAPPIALLLAPFGQLPWLAFVGLWYGLLGVVVVWLGRREMLALLAFPPVALNLADGNIHLLLAAAIVLGFRHPVAWSFVLLTKVTPGIGLLWFAARREWRKLGIALGATAAIVALTGLFLPNQWLSWTTMLTQSAGTPPPWPALPVPLWLRLPAAAAIVIWGARTDRAWAVPLSAILALPALWPGGFAILAACWRLRPPRADYHAPDAVRPDARATPAAGLAARARPA